MAIAVIVVSLFPPFIGGPSIIDRLADNPVKHPVVVEPVAKAQPEAARTTGGGRARGKVAVGADGDQRANCLKDASIPRYCGYGLVTGIRRHICDYAMDGGIDGKGEH